MTPEWTEGSAEASPPLPQPTMAQLSKLLAWRLSQPTSRLRSQPWQRTRGPCGLLGGVYRSLRRRGKCGRSLGTPGRAQTRARFTLACAAASPRASRWAPLGARGREETGCAASRGEAGVGGGGMCSCLNSSRLAGPRYRRSASTPDRGPQPEETRRDHLALRVQGAVFPEPSGSQKTGRKGSSLSRKVVRRVARRAGAKECEAAGCRGRAEEGARRGGGALRTTAPA